MDDKKKPFTSEDRKDVIEPYMDNPEGIKTDKETLFDMHEDMQTVDAIPVEDTRMEWEEEKQENHRKSKDESATEEKFDNQ
ncbi:MULTISPECIES: hypothetical protein [Sporosarcina]|uniref:hypothetical protein n=1 Tax=Sporosarcina TaxID=1569 RepID=UPI00059095E6|nr:MULTISPECIES: hypothetical protein [Sporosarcina]WJY26679.1 hypothetical protein QWT68_11410 [Sporosarcina sp. 0.2-SM1T-5]